MRKRKRKGKIDIKQNNISRSKKRKGKEKETLTSLALPQVGQRNKSSNSVTLIKFRREIGRQTIFSNLIEVNERDD